MKKWAAFLFICCLANNFSQTNISPQFSELKAMEDQLGNTHLFYRIYSHAENFPIYSYTYNDIYHLDLNTSADSLFLRDYIESNPVMFNALSVNDYKFWNNNPNQFIYVGMIGGQDPVPYIYRFDYEYNLLNAFCCEVKAIDISTSDDSLIYSGGQLYLEIQQANTIRSFDGGFNFTPVADTLMFLSLNPFNDNLLFLENFYGSLYRSTDGANSFHLVDLMSEWELSNSFIYDPDQLHIYRIIKDRTLRVSSNMGEAFSWQTKYSSDSEIYISIDESISGTIFLADSKNILVSTDFGNNFSLYKTLERKIVGIYKKPNSNLLYAATKYKIYEITPDSVQIIKTLPIPENVYEWFPLNVGDMWVSYHEQIHNTGDTSKYFLRREVIGFKNFENKVYTKLLVITSPLDNISFREDNYSYYRVDSLNGFIYRTHFQNDSTIWFESLVMDLLAEVGDTIAFSYGAVLESEEPVTLFGVNSTKRNFNVIPPFGQHFELVKGFGLVYDTVWTTTNYVGKLLGCVINGVVYGDTTTVDVEDEENPIASEFKLEQNYPNPFNPITTIRYSIANHSNVTIKVFDILGNEIATLVNEEKSPGTYEVEFSAKGGSASGGNTYNLPSGIYFYQLKAGSFVETKKMLMIK